MGVLLMRDLAILPDGASLSEYYVATADGRHEQMMAIEEGSA
jgi:hypothetical protein